MRTLVLAVVIAVAIAGCGGSAPSTAHTKACAELRHVEALARKQFAKELRGLSGKHGGPLLSKRALTAEGIVPGGAIPGGKCRGLGYVTAVVGDHAVTTP